MQINEKVAINGIDFEIEMTRRHGSYAIARMNGNKISIKIPYHLGKDAATKVFLDLKNKMINRLQREGFELPKPEYLKFYDGQILPIMGEQYNFSISDVLGNKSSARIYDKTVRIKLSGSADQTKREMHVYALSKKAITKAMLPTVVQRVNDINARHFGFQISKIGLRDQMSRWGSYSRRTNSIQLNFRLLFAPSEILDYVIIHELAHVKELNHSHKFWKLVGDVVPEFKQMRKWLRKNGNSLGVYPKPEINGALDAPQYS